MGKGVEEGGGKAGEKEREAEREGGRERGEGVAREIGELREQVARLEAMLREKEKGEGRRVRNDLEKAIGEWGEAPLKRARNRNEEEAWRECERKVMEAGEAGEGERGEAAPIPLLQMTEGQQSPICRVLYSVALTPD